MTLDEMNAALAFTTPYQNGDKFALEPEITFRDVLRETCGLLINVTDSRIFFIHQTAREYLAATKDQEIMAANDSCWKHCIDPDKADHETARLCLAYLDGLELSDNVDDSDEEPDMATYCHQHPFAEYAAMNWYYHVCEGGRVSMESMMHLIMRITNIDKFSESSAWWSIFEYVASSGYDSSL